MDENQTLQALESSTRKYQRAKKAHKEARDEAVSLALIALREGEPPTKVVNASPFTAAYVRKLARENGIQPAK